MSIISVLVKPGQMQRTRTPRNSVWSFHYRKIYNSFLALYRNLNFTTYFKRSCKCHNGMLCTAINWYQGFMNQTQVRTDIDYCTSLASLVFAHVIDRYQTTVHQSFLQVGVLKIKTYGCLIFARQNQYFMKIFGYIFILQKFFRTIFGKNALILVWSFHLLLNSKF